jgi:cysteine desulfurase
MFRRRIYLDNTATTRARREVVSAMSKYFGKVYANPSSIHESGLIARGSIEMARERIAGVLDCRSDGDPRQILLRFAGLQKRCMHVAGTSSLLPLSTAPF